MNKRQSQKGFTLVELLIATAIATIITIASVPMVIAKIEDAGMEGTGAYMALVKVGLERYNLRNHDALAAGTAQAVVSPAMINAYAPTIAELVRDKYITGNSLTDITPQRQQVKTLISTPNCPGVSCVISAIAYTTTPLLYKGSNNPRFDLLLTYLASPGVAGSGLITKPTSDGSQLAGNTGLTVPNPLGAVQGILAITSMLDEALYASFVRRLDTRDPDLRGGLSIQGPSKDGINTLNVTGPTSLNGNVSVQGGDLAIKDPVGLECVKLFVLGQADINCKGLLNAKLGVFSTPTGDVRIGNDGTQFHVTAPGKIKGAGGIYGASGNNVFTAEQPNGIQFTDNLIVYGNGGGGTALALNKTGNLGAQSSLSTPYVGLSKLVVAGTACSSATVTPATDSTPAGSRSSLAAIDNGGFAMCANGVWTPVATPGVLGGPCSPEGSTGFGPNGATLICQGGTFVSLADRFGSLIFSESTLVSNPPKDVLPSPGVAASPIVPNPICLSGASAPRAYVIPNKESQTTQKVNRYLQVVPGGWQVFMIDGDSVHIPDATATVQTYCSY